MTVREAETGVYDDRTEGRFRRLLGRLFAEHGLCVADDGRILFDEEIVEAAKAANAHRFVRRLPDGYGTQVGRRGGRLSGGQRQRLSIARAVLRDPDVLLLDEATSAVDTETELFIQTALAEVTEDRTTFAIAHRLSTVKDADSILVMEDGEIVERGTHGELLDENGLYAHLWRVQAGQIDDLPPEFVERAARRTPRFSTA